MHSNLIQRQIISEHFFVVLQVGLVSDEKLVDLLDLALSADTVNTVKNLRDIMESGVEPLALMSQLATVITDILAGSYDFTRERPRRKFFRRRECNSYNSISVDFIMFMVISIRIMHLNFLPFFLNCCFVPFTSALWNVLHNFFFSCD